MNENPTYTGLKLPLKKEKCRTCPFGENGDHQVMSKVIDRIQGSMQVCHGTEGSNREPRHWCAGAREIQLRIVTAFGILEEPTEKAWEKQCAETGIEYPILKEETNE